MNIAAEITETMRGVTIDITIVADTYADALEARDEYYSRWPTGGYSTSLREARQVSTAIGPDHLGKWIVTGWRGNSS